MTVLLAAAALAINAPGLIQLGYQWRYQRLVSRLKPLPAFKPSDSLLVIAPHPDDETLACAGAVIAARKAGARVHIVWLTSGDGFEWDELVLSRDPLPSRQHMLDLGRRRMEEARQAAAQLGLGVKEYTFLGYPDGGLMRLCFENYEHAYTSRYTGASHVPYSGVLHPGAPYTGASLAHDLSRVVAEVRPTRIFAPSPRDHHHDHRATYLMAMVVLGRLGLQDRARFYIVHGGWEWPVPKGLHPALPLEPPPSGRGLAWLRLDLSAGMVARKREILSTCYKSQMQVLAVPHYMEAFVRTNELFTPQAEPD